MGKLGNFELNAEQRRLLEIKNQRRAELRAQYLKQISDPHRQAIGEGGHLVNKSYKNCAHITSIRRLDGVMSSLICKIRSGKSIMERFFEWMFYYVRCPLSFLLTICMYAFPWFRFSSIQLCNDSKRWEYHTLSISNRRKNRSVMDSSWSWCPS